MSFEENDVNSFISEMNRTLQVFNINPDKAKSSISRLLKASDLIKSKYVNFKDSESIRSTLTKNNIGDLMSNIIFNFYEDFLKGLNLCCFSNLPNYYTSLKIKLQMLSIIKGEKFLDKYFLSYANREGNEGSNLFIFYYYSTILANMHFILNIDYISHMKEEGKNLDGELHKLKECLNNVELVKKEENVILEASLYFIKSLFEKKINYVIDVFRLLDKEYDYTEELFIDKFESDEFITEEIIGMLPNCVLKNSNFCILGAITLIDGTFVINKNLLDYEKNQTFEKMLCEIHSSDQRFDFIINNMNLGGQVAKLMIILLHEMCHKKRIIKFSKGCKYMYSPMCDEKNGRLVEAGEYGEAKIFGKVFGSRINDIDNKISSKLLNFEMWNNKETLHKFVDEVRSNTKSFTNGSNLESSFCFTPGSMDPYRREKIIKMFGY